MDATEKYDKIMEQRTEKFAEKQKIEAEMEMYPLEKIRESTASSKKT